MEKEQPKQQRRQQQQGCLEEKPEKHPRKVSDASEEGFKSKESSCQQCSCDYCHCQRAETKVITVLIMCWSCWNDGNALVLQVKLLNYSFVLLVMLHVKSEEAVKTSELAF